MSVKIKYDANGLKEAEIEIDSNGIKTGGDLNEYKAIHDFLIMTGVLGSKPDYTSEGGLVSVDSSNVKELLPRGRSKHHYCAGRKLAKAIIDAGGLKYLHGVNMVNGRQLFSFDRTEKVASIIDRYNESNSVKAMKKKSEPAPANGGEKT